MYSIEQLKSILVTNEKRAKLILPQFSKEIALLVSKLEKFSRCGDIAKYIFTKWEPQHKDISDIYHKNGLLTITDFLATNLKEIDIYDCTTIDNLSEGQSYSTYTISSLAENYNYTKGMYFISNRNVLILKSSIGGRYPDHWRKMTEEFSYCFEKRQGKSKTSKITNHKSNLAILDSLSKKVKPLILLFVRNDKNEHYIYEGIFEPKSLSEDKNSIIISKTSI